MVAIEQTMIRLLYKIWSARTCKRSSLKGNILSKQSVLAGNILHSGQESTYKRYEMNGRVEDL